MKALILAILVISSASATTKIRLHDSPSTVTGCKAMDLSLGGVGGAVATGITTTTAQSGAINIPMTKTAGGSALAWCTEPIATASGSIGTGTITFNVYGGESATSVNAAFRAKLYYCASPCTTVSGLPANFALGEMATELNATLTTARNWTAGTVTAQAISAGDRLVLILSDENCATSGCPTGNMAAGTTTIHYDGPTDAADGSSWVQTTENLTFSADGGSGGTPSVLQYRVVYNMLTNQLGDNYALQLPNPSGSGNAIVAWCSADAGGSTVISDDQSNTYSIGAFNSDGNSEEIFIWYALNVVANTRKLTIARTVTGSDYFACGVLEATNVAIASALDVSTVNSANSTSVTAGSVTPKYSGDFFFQASWNDYNVATSTIAPGSQSNITWKLIQADRLAGNAAQWGVYASTSALNPTLTYGTAGFITGAIALRSSSAGTAQPSGIRVIGIADTWSNTTSPYNANPLTVQWPCAGNLGVAAYVSGTDDLTAVSDSNNGSWTSTGAAVLNDSLAHNYYIANPTFTNTQTVTLTIGSLTRDSNALLYCISGAHQTAPFDSGAEATTTGNQTVAGNLTTVSITPSAANELIIGSTGVGDTTCSGSVGAGYLFDSAMYSSEPQPHGIDENNCWGHYYAPITSALTFVWTQLPPSTPVANWAARASAFKAPAAASGRRRVTVIQ